MKASVFKGTLEHQIAHAGPMAEGLKRHGIDVEMFDDGTEPTGDMVVAWGWRRCMRYANSRTVLVMERGYVGDRFHWCSLGFNGLNGRAVFPASRDGGERFDRLFGHLLRPWSTRDGYVLVIGQVPGDMSLLPVGGNLAGWYAEARTAFGDAARFRPHPLVARRGINDIVPCMRPIGGNLETALAGARLCVTFNSNTAVESVLAGVPTIACDVGSMAWPVTAHSFDAEPVRPDRTEWAHGLSWRQYSVKEIQNGDAWSALKEVMPCPSMV